DAAETALRELQMAQASLVHAQKMAALGQLTAGIAHEIKNPLNFVNNFSALSNELIDELRDALKPVAFDDKKREELDELTHMLKGNGKGGATRQACRLNCQEHAASFARRFWRAQACRCQRPRRRKPQSRLSRSAGREAGFQHHSEAVF